MLQEVKEEATSAGTIDWPTNAGDRLLELGMPGAVAEMGRVLAERRKEGVRDEDMRWLWNRHDLERRFLFAFGEVLRLARVIECGDKGMTLEEAGRVAGKSFPIYGSPYRHAYDDPYRTGEDAPLPPELKERVHRYVERRKQSDPMQVEKEIEELGSMNALIRKEIRSGNL